MGSLPASPAPELESSWCPVPAWMAVQPALPTRCLRPVLSSTGHPDHSLTTRTLPSTFPHLSLLISVAPLVTGLGQSLSQPPVSQPRPGTAAVGSSLPAPLCADGPELPTVPIGGTLILPTSQRHRPNLPATG